MKYARILNGTVTELVDLVGDIDCRMVDGDPSLRPLIYGASPNFNGTTQRLQERYVVTPTQVLVEYDVVPLYSNVSDLKNALRLAIDAWRDEESHKDVEALGRVWQGNNRSASLLNSAITLASAGAPLPSVWRDATNDNMPVNGLSDLMSIATAIASNVQAAYARSWELKEYVDGLPDTEASMQVLSNLTWNSPLN